MQSYSLCITQEFIEHPCSKTCSIRYYLMNVFFPGLSVFHRFCWKTFIPNLKLVPGYLVWSTILSVNDKPLMSRWSSNLLCHSVYTKYRLQDDLIWVFATAHQVICTWFWVLTKVAGVNQTARSIFPSHRYDLSPIFSSYRTWHMEMCTRGDQKVLSLT